MKTVSEQVKFALEKQNKSTADLAEWLGVGLRQVQKKVSNNTWRASELTILSEKLATTFDVNAPSQFMLNEPAVRYGKQRQPLQLNITISERQINSDLLPEFLQRWDELVKEFEEKK